MVTKQLNIRAEELTHQQITEIAEATGLTITKIVLLAIDRLYAQLVADGTLKPKS